MIFLIGNMIFLIGNNEGWWMDGCNGWVPLQWMDGRPAARYGSRWRPVPREPMGCGFSDNVMLAS